MARMSDKERAEGGTITPGQWYIVGDRVDEAGHPIPERFVPLPGHIPTPAYRDHAIGDLEAQGMDSEPDSLDAAWAEAEAALPEGWTLGVERGPRSSPDAKGAAATAVDWRNFLTAPEGHARVNAIGDDPPAALRALAAKLREAGR